MEKLTNRPPEHHELHMGFTPVALKDARLGHFDLIAELEMDRARRSAGAQATTAKRRSAREKALDVAIAITARNPTLTNEELALKLRTQADLETTVKTIGEWVRVWRREESLPPRKLGD